MGMAHNGRETYNCREDVKRYQIKKVYLLLMGSLLVVDLNLWTSLETRSKQTLIPHTDMVE